MQARKGAVLGLTLAASKADIVAAGLEAVAFQTRDLLIGHAPRHGGERHTASASPSRGWRHDRQCWFLQRLADILGQRVEVALYPETTALGAAYHAGQAIGLYGSAAELEALWRPGAAFEPSNERSASARRAMAAGSRRSRGSGATSTRDERLFCRKLAQASHCEAS